MTQFLTSSFAKNIKHATYFKIANQQHQQNPVNELSCTNLYALVCFLRTNICGSFFYGTWRILPKAQTFCMHLAQMWLYSHCCKSHYYTAFWWIGKPPKMPLPPGGSKPPSNTWSILQTASQSVQRFFRAHGCVQQTDHAKKVTTDASFTLCMQCGQNIGKVLSSWYKNTTTTILQPLYKSTCISQHLQCDLDQSN